MEDLRSSQFQCNNLDDSELTFQMAVAECVCPNNEIKHNIFSIFGTHCSASKYAHRVKSLCNESLVKLVF
jgi:hypothetical protein